MGINEAMLQAEPKTVELRVRLAEDLLRLGEVQRAEGHAADAAAAWRRAVALFADVFPKSAERRVLEACCHAELSTVAGLPGADVSPAQGRAEAATAMTMLREAVAIGFHLVDWLRQETALEPLRSRADFQEMLLDLSFPANPFGRNEGAP